MRYTFNDLPNDLINKIFSYEQLTTSLIIMQFVNKKWYKLAKKSIIEIKNVLRSTYKETQVCQRIVDFSFHTTTFIAQFNKMKENTKILNWMKTNSLIAVDVIAELSLAHHKKEIVMMYEWIINNYHIDHKIRKKVLFNYVFKYYDENSVAIFNLLQALPADIEKTTAKF